MKQHSDLNIMLQQLSQPAFLVEEGQIAAVNAAASACLVREGQALSDFLISGSAEYGDFETGSLFVTVSLCGIQRDACVTRMDQVDLVIVDETRSQEKLEVLALAARALRGPLSGLMTTSEEFFPAALEGKADLEPKAARMNRRLYQMLRIVGNMSDAADFLYPGPMEIIDVCSFLDEILQKAASLTAPTEVQLRYKIPCEKIFTLANPDKLERAMLNLLSNAIIHSKKGTEIHLQLTQKNHRLYISVSNVPVDGETLTDLHNRFLRMPGLEDPRHGIGLGMLLVQNVATIHNGAVLVDRVGQALRVTLSLPIKHGGSQVRSPIQLMDYAGDRDHCLIELSDVLPAEVYSPETLK
jgi:signal transduction histidine kinase